MIDKSTVGEILGVSARIFQSGSDVLPDIEKTPKAKTLPEKRTELFNSLISGLEEKITEYKSLIPKSVEKPEETPQVKIFSSLVTILKEISKKPDDNNNPEISKNLTLIKSLMSELKSPELEKVNKLVETVKYLRKK